MNRFLTVLLVISFFSKSQQSFDNIFKQKGLESALIGISVKDIDSQKIIYEQNSHLQLVPASIFKLISTIAALEKLGTNFQFKTEIYYSGKITGNALNGNLYIKGYGDPCVESRFFKSYNFLQKIYQLIKSSGIQKINGRIIIDNSYFQSKIPGNWVWEDINNYYTAIPYSVNIYDNEYHVYLESEKINTEVKVLRVSPQYLSNPIIEITSSKVTAQQGKDNAYIYGDPLGYQKRIEGTIPPNQKEYSIEGALTDPPRMFAQEIILKLQNENITLFDSHPLISNIDTFNYANKQFLGNISSPALSDIVRLTNLHSINLFAEAIMYAIGKGSYDRAKKEIISWLEQMNININEINIDDACGLSRLNTVSADVMTNILLKAYKSKNRDIILNTLPLTGESGTMKNFSDTAPLKGNLRCKTGYIQRVRTYAGYMTTKSGKTLAICIMYNHFNTSTEKIKQITKTFFEDLYQNF